MSSPAAAQSREVDCLSPEAQRLAEARLAAKRAARAEARDIRMKELERQHKEIYQVQKKYYGLDSKWGDIERWMEDSERCSRGPRRSTSASDEDERASVGSRGSLRVEERPEKDFSEKGSRGLSAATLASLGGPSSRRGSAETSTSVDTEASIREIKDSLAEVEEKYKRAMVSNAQLDNEKTNFMYQVDTLKEVLLDLEEQLAEARRQHEEKSRELEREKHAHGLLRLQLAEATAALKQREEMLEKHGIILSSEVTTNGEASDPLRNAGCPAATKVTKEELNAIKATADGTLGRAGEVEVKDEIVQKVGKGEIVQNPEQEQPTEDPRKDCVHAEVLRADESAGDRDTPEDSAPSPGTAAEAAEETQVQSQSLEGTTPLERTEQGGSGEAVSTPDGPSGAPPVQAGCLGELDGGSPGPRLGEVSRDAPDGRNQGEKPAEAQEQATRGSETGAGAGGSTPRQEPAALPAAEAGGVTSTDPGDPSGSPTPGPAGAGLTGLGEQAGTVASSPPRSGEDTASREDECVADVPVEPDSSTGGGLETEPASQGEARRAPLGPREPSEESNDPPGEALESPQRKTKSKRKKNKKKKAPAPVETPQEVRRELASQTPALSDSTEGGQVAPPDKTPAEEAQHEAREAPGPEGAAAGSRDLADGPENPNPEPDGQLPGGDSEGRAEPGEVAADGEPLPLEGATVEASGAGAGDRGLDEGAATGDADGGAPPGSPSRGDAPRGEGTEGRAVPECPGARAALDSISLEDHDVASAGETGDPVSESKEEARGRNEDKSREDCTLS